MCYINFTGHCLRSSTSQLSSHPAKTHGTPIHRVTIRRVKLIQNIWVWTIKHECSMYLLKPTIYRIVCVLKVKLYWIQLTTIPNVLRLVPLNIDHKVINMSNIDTKALHHSDFFPNGLRSTWEACIEHCWKVRVINQKSTLAWI